MAQHIDVNAMMRVLRDANFPICLHLGCKDVRIPRMIGVDINRDAKGADIVADVSTLANFDSGSVDMIYASHILEHFGRHEYLSVLGAWSRVLRRDGLLRISVPDFGAVVAEYLANGIDKLTGLLHGGQRDEYDYHKIIFDEAMLTRDMNAVGITDVKRWDWRTTVHAEIDDASQAYLPHMDKENGRHMSLNLEGRKR